MKPIALKITLCEPTLVLMLGSGDANQQKSFDYIPGSVIRSMLAARYIEQHGLQATAATNDTCRQLFFEDKVRFLNAYPLDRHGSRSLPTPLSWLAKKEELADFEEKKPLKIYDFSQEKVMGDSFKGVGQEFCLLTGNDVEFISPQKRIMAHNARTQRRLISDGTSQVFQYEALDKEQAFGALILIDDSVKSEDLESQLTGHFTIGKSRSAGYGRVKFEVVTTDLEKWREPEFKFEDLDSAKIVVTCLSDALVRDEHGSYTTELGHVLGIKQCEAFLKTTIVGGFNRKWGLPLPQVQAIQKGSVFVFEANTETVDWNKLIETGIGERRGEGFGRIAVNWQQEAELTARKYPPESKANDISLKSDDHAGELAQRIVQAQLRHKLDQQLLSKISTLTIEGNPSKSLLSRVRLVARQALKQNRIEVVKEFLQDVRGDTKDKQGNIKIGEGKKQAYKELERCRIKGDTTLFAWLMRYTDLQQVKNSLSFSSHSLGHVEAEFNVELQIEYAAKLIEGVVKQEQKRREE